MRFAESGKGSNPFSDSPHMMTSPALEPQSTSIRGITPSIDLSIIIMEKTQLSHSHPHSVSPERSTRPSPSKVRRVVHAAVGLSFALLLFLYIPRSGLLSSHQTIRRFHCGFFSSPDNDAQRLIRPMEPLEDRTHHANKVPLEAHIMSKCPDAQYCLRKLVVPTMERVSDLVDFNLAFIAK